MTTPNLQLPEPPDFASPIAAEERDGQRALDALGPGWIAVLSGSTAAPPGSAPQGARYLVPLGATGAWASHARHIAYMTPIGWGYRAPRRGWVALVLDEGPEGLVYQYDGTEWVRMSAAALDLAALTAADINFDGYGLEGDPATVDAALDVLFGIADDHETRIANLEAGGGGGGGGAMVFIGEAIAGGSVASLTVSSIPAGYRTLVLLLRGRGVAGGAVFQEVFLQFNGDTGNNYDFQQQYAIAGSPGQDATGSTNKLRVAHFPSSAATANRPGVATAHIHFYDETTFDKVVHSEGGMFGSTSPSDFLVNHYSGIWRPATPAAINSITVLIGVGNMAAGTRMAVYAF